jgi:hypothetical protein
MKNITLIIAFIIGTSFALSAQRGGTTNTNTNSGLDKDNRGNSTISTKNRGGASNHGRTGNGRPTGHATNGSPSNNGRGGGHYNNGHNNNNGHHNNGHYNNGHNNNGHHNNGHNNNGHNNNGHHNNGHNNGHHNNGHNNGHHNNGHNNGHHNNGHHGHNYNSYCNYSNHNYGWNAVCVTDFNIGCRSIRSFGYDSDRLRSAKRFVRNNYVSSHQIADMMRMFSFESTKLEFAKYAFHRTCDVQNYGTVFNHLGFNSSRRDLDCYIRDFQW